MKLAARMMMKEIRKMFQSKETIDRRFRTPTRLRIGSAIPSIRQWTLPHERPLMKHPVPIHVTETTQMTPVTVEDIIEARQSPSVTNIIIPGTPQRR